MRTTRRELLAGGLALAICAAAGRPAAAASKPAITVHKSPT
jgi:hypothetical protein